MLFHKHKEVEKVFKAQISDEHYKRVELWKSIYAGEGDEFKENYFTINKGTQTRKRKSLNMAKVSAEELSKLIFTEKVEININDKTFSDNISETLDNNRFYKEFQQKLEVMFALGGIVPKVFPKKQYDGTYKLLITYVTPDCFIPLSHENGDITEAAFLNVTKKNDKIYCLFEVHRWKEYANENKGTSFRKYVVNNVLFEGDKNSQDIKQVPLNTLYPELKEVTEIENLTESLFRYFKPNIANNKEINSPMGISIFANSIDTLHLIDIAFDSFMREFRLGRRRILVPAESVRTVLNQKTGELERYFDADDEVYQAFRSSDPDKAKIQDNTVELRVDEHINAINALLDLYAMQVGFSAGTFTFDGKGGIKTATEVISEQSKTFRTKQSHENLIEENLIKFIKTLGEVAKLYNLFDTPEKLEIGLQWDDSIIQDRDGEIDYLIKLLQNDLASKKYAIMKALKFTDKQAEEMLSEIEAEKPVMPEFEDGLDEGLIGGAE